MAGRPPKPVNLIKLEGKSHRTKAELEAREKAEKQLLTGIEMKAWPEVRDDKTAKKEFSRLKKLLKIIGHNDAIHEAVINRYCLLTSECKKVEDIVDRLRDDLEELSEARDNGDIEAQAYFKEKGAIQNRLISWDTKLMDKRKMLLQIEKENVMTIMAALRSIPKKPEEEQESAMAKYLREKREKQSR